MRTGPVSITYVQRNQWSRVTTSRRKDLSNRNGPCSSHNGLHRSRNPNGLCNNSRSISNPNPSHNASNRSANLSRKRLAWSNVRLSRHPVLKLRVLNRSSSVLNPNSVRNPRHVQRPHQHNMRNIPANRRSFLPVREKPAVRRASLC